ncbi:uncharacterized protein MYCFIDRAFT_197731 [Pseudocercospora fijiensis CIRAD86]|uniref:Transcription factor IIIC 90kDa subunit N-terminal domain-containing protein n=1 Tax=Pseudocercospora fijiensis (strain CIRAD86) TaxID=383855 RepID=M3AUM4_PSEFD|nr:uncharacterized protein MYCFIDRAFT_197731 [Pseudocercospora fijiensis CIRAD86]EME80843.1 hypothetical protein MYCFIDRAFT_197731 [Pseudocercospora fijiensis CIRAD86]
MACSITLPFWPSALDCIDWSLDNHMAVVAGENVSILIPRLHASHAPFWDAILVQVNAFTLAELPLFEPLSDQAFSIGEEVALRQVQAAKWSPPGLARFGRCALAVLTSNHVLSLWSPSGKVHLPTNWKRNVIINHAVRAYYKQHLRGQADDSEQAQVQQRIVAFAWSPALHSGSERHNEHLFHGSHFLAVATEANHILLLHISSPECDSLGRKLECQMLVTDNISVAHRVSHIAWSSWQPDESGGKNTSTLSYIAGGKLFSAKIRAISAQAVRAVSGEKQVHDLSNAAGPLLLQRGAMLAFGPDIVYHVTPDQDQMSHHLDDRWDPIAGAAITDDALHIASQMSTTTTATASLRVSKDEKELQPHENPQWKDAILEYKSSYGAQHDLASKVQERTWGMASSPLGGFIATCASMHPADTIAYVISSDQVTLLSITSESIRKTVLGDVTSMDVLSFYMRHCQCQTPPKVQPTTQDPASHTNVDDLLRSLRTMIYSTELRQMQMNTTMALIDGGSCSSPDSIKFVTDHITKLFLSFPAVGLQIDRLSLDICNLYDLALSKVDAKHALGDLIASAKTWSERCTICHESIPFESFKWARCAKEHQFARCALSLLSIQGPGSTKHCGICGLQYLDETKSLSLQPKKQMAAVPVAAVPGADQSTIPANSTWVKISRSGSTTARTTTTLAQLLFAACDRSMESNIHASTEGVRFSNSPRRYTQVMEGPQSPARSMHPEHSGLGLQMENIDSQADFGHRTTDYFDDTSEDEEAPPPVSGDLEAVIGRSGSPSKKKRPISSTQMMVSQCEPKRVSIRPEEPRSEGYERIDSNLNQQVPDRATATPDTSFNGSVEEFLPGEASTPQQAKAIRLSSTTRFRTSGLYGSPHSTRSGDQYRPPHERDARMSQHHDNFEQRLGIHAAAYDKYLHSMLEDPELARLDPLNNPRASQIPPRLSINSKKKVSVVRPPPLASADRGEFPENPQRTPYPFYKSPSLPKDSALPKDTENFLILSIRRGYRNGSTRTTGLRIPSEKAQASESTYSVPGAQEKASNVAFDDQNFFNELRAAYASLAGPFRFFSARKLTRIALKGPATKAADAQYGWIPSSPGLRPASWKGSAGLSVEKAYTYYQRPALGKGRVPYVKWARELAAAGNLDKPPQHMEKQDLTRLETDSEPSEGLEFVVGWSISRILFALLLVLLLAVAATLLWIFLGRNTAVSSPAPANAGFRDAGDRVGTGVLIGVLVLFIGMTGISGWIGVSWLVM